jgi:hypothetical protein
MLVLARLLLPMQRASLSLLSSNGHTMAVVFESAELSTSEAGASAAAGCDRHVVAQGRTFFAYVTTLSATLRSSFAFGKVVCMRSCSSSCVTMVLLGEAGTSSDEAA